ncbi:hypothetical protein J5N97_010108 [Dioscorea zingiberensis]|uniref:Epidermal patterning factor-like protein n=1 Tax=Dioscorea zingiberensis TaxID=325984 RepID=A0A9D5CYS6_9LILI|nr:hypothetical protein J5N97_010108 [Dioscorea zingiberensis]
MHANAFLSLLLLLGSIQVKHLAESRPLLKLLENAKEREKEIAMVGALIGSRPPRCEGRCSSCGHCEAVQVPLAPQDKISGGLLHHLHFSTTINSRFDDNSNYKPMGWKCKCGALILNP